MTSAPNVTIDQALTDPALLGAALGDTSTWATWVAVLKASFGITLNIEERLLFASVAGDREPPTERLQELWTIVGRGGGKSRVSAATAIYLACFHKHDLDPGETGHVLVLAASRDQAQVVFSYCSAFLRRSPVLRQMIKHMTSTEIRLNNNVTIAVHSNSFRSIRGRTLLAVIFDEVSVWRDDLSANPDVETYRAVKPSLIRTGGMLIGISTPYRRTGLLYAKYKDHFGTNDSDVLVVKGASVTFNPTLDQAKIDKEIAKDREGAFSEWYAEFRSDVSALFDDKVIEDAIDYGRPLELPPRGSRKYHCFVDASAGRHDAFTLCIGHLEGEKGEETCVADVIRGRLAPFDPRTVAEEYAALARAYHCNKITGDAFAGEWVAAAFRDAGARYETSPLNKSVLYLEALPGFNRGAVAIPNHEWLLRELRGLERRVHRSGKDSVDHPTHGSDDFANALCCAAPRRSCSQWREAGGQMLGLKRSLWACPGLKSFYSHLSLMTGSHAPASAPLGATATLDQKGCHNWQTGH
jgi:hypothetical protein